MFPLPHTVYGSAHVAEHAPVAGSVASLGGTVGESVGLRVGYFVGLGVGAFVGENVGAFVG